MTQLLNDFLSGSAAWGVLLTLAAFALGTLINKVTGKAIFNPLLLGSIFVIIFLSVCSIPYADYKVSAAPVNYLLLPPPWHWPFRCMKNRPAERERRRHHCGYLGGHAGEPWQRTGADTGAGPDP